jgi:hypothetical protein
LVAGAGERLIFFATKAQRLEAVKRKQEQRQTPSSDGLTKLIVEFDFSSLCSLSADRQALRLRALVAKNL